MSYGPAHDARSRRRMVVVVRALLLCASVSLLTPLPGLFREGPIRWVSLATVVGLALLSALYVAVLIAAQRGYWDTARRLLFTGWTLYPVSLVLVYRPELDPFVQIILLGVADIFIVLVEVAMLALAPWRQVRGWIAFMLGITLVAYLRPLALVSGSDLTSLGSYVGVSFALLLATLLPLRAILADLEDTIAQSEEARLDAQTAREAAALARDRALAANTAKSRFLANMSHELRTPLNAILGYVELIGDEAHDAEIDRFDDDLDRIHASGTHLLGLINAILDLSKVEAGKIEVEDAPFDPNALLDELVSTITPLTRQKGLELRTEIAHLPTVTSDAVKIRQILLNLLANAVKFTDRGSITLVARAELQHLVVTVVDTGVGIASDRLDAVFEAFERTDAEVTRRVGGTGLGLAIARRLCELLGGSLSVESHMGVGSTFVVRLPIRPPARRRTSFGELVLLGDAARRVSG